MNKEVINILGALSSGSTFILYGITILLMILTGIYNIYDNNTADFRWKNKNTAIMFPIVANFLMISLFLACIAMFYILKDIGVAIITAAGVFCGKIVFKKIKNEAQIKYAQKVSNFYLGCIICHHLFYFGIKAIKDGEIKKIVTLLLIIVIVISIPLLFFSIMKPIEAYDLKEYIFCLTDKRYYLAKLETIKEGFLVLHDVKEFEDDGIDKLKPESVKIKAIIDKFNDKKSTENDKKSTENDKKSTENDKKSTENDKISIEDDKRIVAKEQVISMYIVENNKNNENNENNEKNEKNTKRNYKISKNFIIGFLIFIINITSFVKRTNSNIYKGLILSFIISFIGLILIQILNDFIKNNELKNDFFEINNTLIIDVIIFILYLFFFKKIAQFKIRSLIFVVAIDLIYLLIKYLIREKDNDTIKYAVNKNILMLVLVAILIIVSFMEKGRMNYLIIGIPTILSIMIMYFIFIYKKVG